MPYNLRLLFHPSITNHNLGTFRGILEATAAASTPIAKAHIERALYIINLSEKGDIVESVTKESYIPEAGICSLFNISANLFYLYIILISKCNFKLFIYTMLNSFFCFST